MAASDFVFRARGVGRRDFQQWITDRQSPLTLTLGANREFSAERLRLNATDFFHRVHRKCYGTRWMEKEEFLASAIGFLEHPHTNPHYHMAVDAPVRVQSVLVNAEPIWKKIMPGGHFYCQRVEDQDAFARYVTKDAWSAESQDGIFLYSARRP